MAKNTANFRNKLAGLVSTTLYITGLALVAFLVSGFIRFTIIVAGYDDRQTPTGDAIVVLTGGKARIETGLNLLENGRAKRMLISGVNPQTTENAIVRIFSSHSRLFSCCVELDHVAENTVQNAQQIAKWVNTNDIENIIVVTSDYHMPRALLELSRIMPSTSVFPHVARRRPVISNANIDTSGELKILAKEYLKTLAASFLPHAN